ncbi:hypothetical protein OH77DRAFT_1518926 [Trametes cingulata]|nr:hypothetical protein OH77DRAFT_1518926 [Trametes cingulata]
MATAGGLYVHKDTGAPSGRNDYTTLVIVHGYVWHGGIFAKIIPLAPAYGVRIILLNRREYPGAVPYTAEERALIPPVPDKPRTDEREIRSAAQMLQTFMRDRAYELYQALQALVTERDIPPGSRSVSETGGIVLVGWSMGATWMTALLSYVREFRDGGVDHSNYIRRVALWDPPSWLLGYPFPEKDWYDPLHDTSLSYEERGQAFTKWITAYFAHGETLDEFKQRTPLRDPPSTIAAMTKEEFETTVHVPPGLPHGSDWSVLYGCFQLGVYDNLRKGALYLTNAENEWSHVEVRYVWGDHSVWEVPYAAQLLREEVAEAKKCGKPIRNVTTLRVKGANHFGQWDLPEPTLQAFLVGAEKCDV